MFWCFVGGVVVGILATMGYIYYELVWRGDY